MLLWALLLAGGGARELRGLHTRDVGVALALGAGCNAARAGCDFAALERIDASLLSLLVYTFPAIVAVAAIALGASNPPGELTPAGWGWPACLAVVSTVASISWFFAGLDRVGTTSVSILATVEPLVTVLLALALFRETLSGLQLAGGAVLLAGLITLQAAVPRTSDGP